ncbi:MAG: ATP-binding cassette domain-containing protein [Aliidiomarina sp.]|uniref:ABC transporter ATP-binding protein/permease n=1 Tax=Aliidiomarina sp. TaxID=1872439 RepID=UPI0025C1FA2B|nr:ABC transporter transmembrane domain-containing protein [Aliidiomarina sp.]MCH8500436.1 ATP-binding cassette domain-containing protein [Aliidiomarina sp.]
MSVKFAQEKRYLQQLRATTGRSLLWSCLFGSVQSLTLVVQFALSAWLIEAFFQEQLANTKWLWWTLLLTIVIRVVSGFFYKSFSLSTATKAKTRAQQQVLDYWQWQLHQGDWQSNKNTNAANDLIEPIEHLSGYFGRYLPQLWLGFWQPFVILIVVFYLNWLAGLFLLVTAPLIPLFMALIGMGAERVHQQHLVSIQRLSGIFIDRIRNLTLLFLLQKLPMARRHIDAANDEYRELNMKTLRIAFLSSAVLEFFAAIAIAAIAIYIGFSLLGYYAFPAAESLTLFSGLLILLLAPEFFQPLRQLSQYYHDRAAALGAASILSRQIAPAAVKTAGEPCVFPLQSKPLIYSYADRGVPIHYPALTLEAGQLTLLTGPSGSGKSTLLQLLAGLLPGLQFYDATTNKYRPHGLRNIAYLPQTPWLRNASVLTNLATLLPPEQQPEQLSPSATAALTEQALEICRQLGLEPMLKRFPLGLNTNMSEFGAGVSGGEAKRIALGRWLLAIHLGFKPDLMLLDEPTAELDKVSTEFVCSALREVKQRGVCLVVASHSRDFVPFADQVIALGNSEEHPCD